MSLNISPPTPSLDPLLDLMQPALAAVNSIIIDRMQGEIELIPRLAGHLIRAGGKRIRPMLALAGAMVAGGRTDENTARLAAAIEFIHTATLLHDDVIDASAMRRGRETANMIWGNEASVLVGDFLFARAFELLVEVGDITILGKIAHSSIDITEGELSQLLIAGKPDTSITQYIQVIMGKTAKLFASAAETGAMLAGGDAALTSRLHDYGMALGIAFQIADDALDYADDEGFSGKSVGDDFMEGKITLPVMLAWQDGTDDERAFWERCLTNGAIIDGDMSEAQAILSRHNAINRALVEAGFYAERAEACLADVPKNPVREGLIAAARFAAKRTA